MAGLQTDWVVDCGGVEAVWGVIVVVIVGGVVGVTQGISGTRHWPADSVHFSTWPLGERQSLFWELSQVPGKGKAA